MEKINTSAFGVKSMALNMLTDWNRTREEDGQHRGSEQINRRQWFKPPAGWIKVNIDATCRQGGEHVGVGCVVRDDSGGFLRARTNIVRGRSILNI